MDKHSIIKQKVGFLTRLQYTTYAKASRATGLSKSITKDIKVRTESLFIEAHKQSLPVPTLTEQATRNPRSGTKPNQKKWSQGC